MSTVNRSASPSDLTASAALALIRDGELSATELVQACLDRIAEREDVVRAWQFLDPTGALAAARALDELPKDQRGPLHGIPVGLKDIIDTAGMPTEYGSPVYAGHRPTADAACVQRLQEAGAVVLGKTVTTEFATWSPARTTNPHDPAHTPGGSSSGSAAATGDRMVPLALGTQTVGSTIRPASFCGATAMKATPGRLDLTGFKRTSARLDTMGMFARDVADLALVWEVLGGPPGDRSAPPGTDRELRIGMARTPWWDQADEDSRHAMAVAAAQLDAQPIDLPAGSEDVVAAHDLIANADVSRHLLPEYRRAPELISEVMHQKIAAGLETTAAAYLDAVRITDRLRHRTAALFETVDVLLVPAVTGEAPAGLDWTGDPIFCRPWSMLGNPAVTVPITTGRRGLPVGVQLVAGHGKDGDVLRAAAVLTPG